MLIKTLWPQALCVIAFMPAIAGAQEMTIAEITSATWSTQAQPAPTASAAASANSFAELSSAPAKNSTADAHQPDRPAFLLPLAGLAALLFVARRHSSTSSTSLPATQAPRRLATSRLGSLGADTP